MKPKSKYKYVFAIIFDASFIPPVAEVMASVNNTMNNDFGIPSELKVGLPLLTVTITSSKRLGDDEQKVATRTIKESYCKLLPQYKVMEVKLLREKSHL